MGRHALVILLLSGCPGEAIQVDQRVIALSDSAAADTGQVPLDGPSTTPDGPSTTPDGPCVPGSEKADCDVQSGSGCTNGRCYFIKGIGIGCQCPEGTIKAGENCSTSTDCAIGHVCARTGEENPTCRELCVPSTSGCSEGWHCLGIDDFPGHGYCEPDI